MRSGTGVRARARLCVCVYVCMCVCVCVCVGRAGVVYLVSVSVYILASVCIGRAFCHKLCVLLSGSPRNVAMMINIKYRSCLAPYVSWPVVPRAM